MPEIDKLIDAYLNSKQVYEFDSMLKILANHTIFDNYMYIINKIDSNSISTELDLSLYINDISNPNYVDLEDFIHSKLLVFKDSDAIEDLQNALIKLSKPNC